MLIIALFLGLTGSTRFMDAVIVRFRARGAWFWVGLPAGILLRAGAASFIHLAVSAALHLSRAETAGMVESSNPDWTYLGLLLLLLLLSLLELMILFDVFVLTLVWVAGVIWRIPALRRAILTGGRRMTRRSGADHR